MNGRWFEDFTPGERIPHWPGRTITEHDNTWFALLSMNLHPLWIDRHFAGDPRPVIDTLVFNLAVGMSVADTSSRTIANLGYESVVFEQPLYVGDSIYAESEVLAARESESRPDRGIVSIETRAFNQKRERVLVLRRSFLMPRRPR